MLNSVFILMNANAININTSIWDFQAPDPGTAVKGSLLNPQLVAGGPRLPLVGNQVLSLVRVARSQPTTLLTLPNRGCCLPTANSHLDSRAEMYF